MKCPKQATQKTAKSCADASWPGSPARKGDAALDPFPRTWHLQQVVDEGGDLQGAVVALFIVRLPKQDVVPHCGVAVDEGHLWYGM